MRPLPAVLMPYWQRMKDLRDSYATQHMRKTATSVSVGGTASTSAGATTSRPSRTSGWQKTGLAKRVLSRRAAPTDTARPSESVPTRPAAVSAATMALEGSTDLAEYELLGVLGRGTFGVVKLARHRQTGRSVAIKILDKEIVQEMRQEKNILREQTVHLLLSHPFVARLYVVFQDKRALYFVMEYCPGGEVYSLVYYQKEEECGSDDDATDSDGDNQGSSSSADDDTACTTDTESEEELNDKGNSNGVSDQRPIFALLNAQAKAALRSSYGGLKEQYAAFYLACMVSGLEYLHDMSILYRDLKLENVVLDAQGYPKLIDFGLSKPDAVRSDSRSTTMCGSMEYMAPEVLQRKPYDHSADLWSFGIIMYELLLGSTPFFHANSNEQGRRITSEPVSFPNSFEDEFPRACELITALLSKNPQDRPSSFTQVRQSAFFKHYFSTAHAWQQLQTRQLTAPFVPKLQDAFDRSLFACVEQDDDEAYDDFDEESSDHGRLPPQATSHQLEL